jgi:hypothetical protein
MRDGSHFRDRSEINGLIGIAIRIKIDLRRKTVIIVCNVRFSATMRFLDSDVRTVRVRAVRDQTLESSPLHRAGNRYSPFLSVATV